MDQIVFGEYLLSNLLQISFYKEKLLFNETIDFRYFKIIKHHLRYQ